MLLIFAICILNDFPLEQFENFIASEHNACAERISFTRRFGLMNGFNIDMYENMLFGFGSANIPIIESN